MPWMETSPVEQRERFLADHRAGHLKMTELCRRYGISRKTGYKGFDYTPRRGGRPARPQPRTTAPTAWSRRSPG